MSCTSPLTVASTMRPLPASSSDFSMCGSRYATAVFITSADCSTNGSCIWPEPNSSPTVFMPASRFSLMIVQRRLLRHRLVEVGFQAVALAVDDALRQPFQQRQFRELGGARSPSTTQPRRPRTCPSAPAAGRNPRGGGRRRDPARPRAAPRGSGSSAGSCDACTIAESRPASWHSCRNTELSTWRAAGFRPNEMFDRPSVVCTSGCFCLSSRIASMVSRPSLRDSSWPVQIVNVKRVDEDRRLVDAPVAGDVGDQPLGDLHLLARRCGPGPPRRWSAPPPRRRARRRAPWSCGSATPGRRRPRSSPS